MYKIKKRERIIYLDLLRIIATIAVITLHVAAQKWSSVNISSKEWLIFNFFDSAVRWSVPIFVMISGALFLDNDKPLDTQKIYTKHIFRIITAFVFWSALYSIINAFPEPNLKIIIGSFVKGHYHLWFLYMIISLYIITPILRKITESKKLTEYFLIIGIIFTILIPSLITLVECIASPNINLLISSFKTSYLKMDLNLNLNFILYFVLGFYLFKYNLRPKLQKISYLLGIIGLIVTFILTTWYSNKLETASVIFYDNFTINVMLMSVGIFLFSKYILSKINLSEKVQKLILKLSKYSFGTYLVHILVIDKIAEYFNLNTLTFNPIISIFIIVILVTIISYIISFVIHKIPFLKKYIV